MQEGRIKGEPSPIKTNNTYKKLKIYYIIQYEQKYTYTSLKYCIRFTYKIQKTHWRKTQNKVDIYNSLQFTNRYTKYTRIKNLYTFGTRRHRKISLKLTFCRCPFRNPNPSSLSLCATLDSSCGFACKLSFQLASCADWQWLIAWRFLLMLFLCAANAFLDRNFR